MNATRASCAASLDAGRIRRRREARGRRGARRGPSRGVRARGWCLARDGEVAEVLEGKRGDVRGEEEARGMFPGTAAAAATTSSTRAEAEVRRRRTRRVRRGRRRWTRGGGSRRGGDGRPRGRRRGRRARRRERRVARRGESRAGVGVGVARAPRSAQDVARERRGSEATRGDARGVRGDREEGRAQTGRVLRRGGVELDSAASRAAASTPATSSSAAANLSALGAAIAGGGSEEGDADLTGAVRAVDASAPTFVASLSAIRRDGRDGRSRGVWRAGGARPGPSDRPTRNRSPLRCRFGTAESRFGNSPFKRRSKFEFSS